MKSVAKWLVVVALVAIVANPASAQEEKKGKGKRQAQNPAVKALAEQLKTLDLSDEQAGKIKELTAGAGEKLAAIAKQRAELITPETAQKMAEARKEAAAAGKKGKELQEAVNAAAGLTGEKAEQLKEIQAKQQAVVAELKKSVGSLLSEEQRAKVGLNAPAKGNKKPKKDS